MPRALKIAALLPGLLALAACDIEINSHSHINCLLYTSDAAADLRPGAEINGAIDRAQ